MSKVGARVATLTEPVRDVVLGGEVDDEIRDIIRSTFLDTEFESKWMPARVQRCINPALDAQYEEKRQDLLVRGRRQDEMEDRYGFVVDNNVSSVAQACAAGLHNRDSDYNALGYNCMGVYLCRHADVCLQHALVKYAASCVARLLICKYMPGRQTTAIPRVASAADFIEPTQGFDSHLSVIPPRHTDSLQNQFDRSQVYLYEINNLLQPAPRPRQVLPYALVTFTLDGLNNSAVDDELVPVEPPAPPALSAGGAGGSRPPGGATQATQGNPQLQEIIARINARLDPSSMPGGGGGDPRGPAGWPGRAGGLVSGPGGGAGLSVRPGGLVSGGVAGDDGGQSDAARLQRAIQQVNWRLESEQTRHFPAVDDGRGLRGPVTSQGLGVGGGSGGVNGSSAGAAQWTGVYTRAVSSAAGGLSGLQGARGVEGGSVGPRAALGRGLHAGGAGGGLDGMCGGVMQGMLAGGMMPGMLAARQHLASTNELARRAEALSGFIAHGGEGQQVMELLGAQGGMRGLAPSLSIRAQGVQMRASAASQLNQSSGYLTTLAQLGPDAALASYLGLQGGGAFGGGFSYDLAQQSATAYAQQSLGALGAAAGLTPYSPYMRSLQGGLVDVRGAGGVESAAGGLYQYIPAALAPSAVAPGAVSLRDRAVPTSSAGTQGFYSLLGPAALASSTYTLVGQQGIKRAAAGELTAPDKRPRYF